MSSYIKVGQDNSTPIEVHYEDHGSGSPAFSVAVDLCSRSYSAQSSTPRRHSYAI
jgi:hypothetical protein